MDLCRNLRRDSVDRF